VGLQLYSIYTDPGYTPTVQETYQKMSYLTPVVPSGAVTDPATGEIEEGTLDYSIFPVFVLEKLLSTEAPISHLLIKLLTTMLS